MAFKLPKGVSNSSKMGATPGTVTSAVRNVTGANINPNMPREPQLQRQSRSDLQRGLMGRQMPTPMPQAPTPSPRPAQAPRQTPVVSRGMPMDPSRGYNIFSGQTADEISMANQKMGLSNMTALPSLTSPIQIDPAINRLNYGQPQSMMLMSGQADSPFVGSYGPTVTTESLAASFLSGEADPTKPPEQQPGQSDESYQKELEMYKDAVAEYQEQFAEGQEEYLFGGALEEQIKGSGEFAGSGMSADEEIASAKEAMGQDVAGLDPEKKQEMFDMLDQEYAYGLQFALDNLDRQAAMMGTFGSGSHMRNVNNAIAQTLSDMATKYNEINKLDAAAMELDYQQEVDNYLKLAAGVSGSLQDKINIGQKVDELVITPYAQWIESQEGLDANTKQELQGWLVSTAADLFQNLISQGYSPEEAIAIATQQVKEAFNSLGIYPEV